MTQSIQFYDKHHFWLCCKNSGYRLIIVTTFINPGHQTHDIYLEKHVNQEPNPFIPCLLPKTGRKFIFQVSIN